VKNGELKDRRGNPKPEIQLIAQASKDDWLMMNPFFPERTVYHTEHIRNWWKRILKDCCFEKKYTLYSLRSTYITHALLKGIRTRVIADNAGSSEAMIEKTYYLLNNLLNIDELGFHKETGDDELVID
jgi:integrase